MSSRFRTSLIAALAIIWTDAASARADFAICVEPNNMPFANRAGEGLEPRIAALLAEGLHTSLTIVPVAQTGRGYVRSTLGRGRCDAIMSVPAEAEGMTTTSPYYEAGWVFVSPADRRIHVRSFDDPVLKRIRIGVPVVGEGYDTPPLAALGRRGIADNLHLYGISGLGSEKRMPVQMIDDLAKGRIDLAILWGPFAGYYAAEANAPVAIEPTPVSDGPYIPMTMPIAIGVSRGNTELRDVLNVILVEKKKQIDEILASYHVAAVRE